MAASPTPFSATTNAGAASTPAAGPANEPRLVCMLLGMVLPSVFVLIGLSLAFWQIGPPDRTSHQEQLATGDGTRLDRAFELSPAPITETVSIWCEAAGEPATYSSPTEFDGVLRNGTSGIEEGSVDGATVILELGQPPADGAQIRASWATEPAANVQVTDAIIGVALFPLHPLIVPAVTVVAGVGAFVKGARRAAAGTAVGLAGALVITVVGALNPALRTFS